MTTLTPGTNSALPSAGNAKLAVSTGHAHADLVVLVVDQNNKADNENGVAFWNQPSCAGGAVTITGDPAGPGTGQDYANINLSALPANAERVIIVAQADWGMTLKECVSVTGVLSVDGAPVATLSIPNPPAVQTMQIGELYRHNGAWKVRCLGDGYADGLAKLLTVHGIDVDDEPAEAPASTSTPAEQAPTWISTGNPLFGARKATPAEPAPAAQAPAPVADVSRPVVRLTKGEDKLPAEERAKLSLRKEKVAKVMLEKKIANVTARIILVMDCSGSMSWLFSNKTVQETVKRVVAVAAQMDDDGEMEAWRFASESSQVPSMELASMPAWVDHCMVMDEGIRNHTSGGGTGGGGGGGLFGRKKAAPTAPNTGFGRIEKVGWSNNEDKVIADVRKFIKKNPTTDPTFVLFFSDGGVGRNEPIERELKASSLEPVFWQFIGLGSSGGYGILEKFDKMTDRPLDNTGFFSVDNIQSMSDDELYKLILSEFPEWVHKAKAMGVIA